MVQGHSRYLHKDGNATDDVQQATPHGTVRVYEVLQWHIGYKWV